jgi:hypothetical protein
MKILSIDIGIKNLALCVLETTNTGFQIKFWEVINLCEEKMKICGCSTKNKKELKKCTKDAKYHKNNNFYCKTHAAKSEFKLPTTELNKYKRLKMQDLCQLTSDHDILVTGPNTKANLLDAINVHINKYVLENVSNMECKKLSLIDIGISIKENLDRINTFIFTDIDMILIENQISPIANRMNCIQGMISQYFIMKEMKNIQFISAANKLKAFIGNKKTTYCERKRIGIEVTKNLLVKNDDNNINTDKIIDMFNKHKKKDDLADCFLQGIWYLSSGSVHPALALLTQNINLE